MSSGAETISDFSATIADGDRTTEGFAQRSACNVLSDISTASGATIAQWWGGAKHNRRFLRAVTSSMQDVDKLVRKTVAVFASTIVGDATA